MLVSGRIKIFCYRELRLDTDATRFHFFVLSIDYMEFSDAMNSLAPPPQEMIDYKKIDWGWLAMGMRMPEPGGWRNEGEVNAKGVYLVSNAIDILEMNGVFSDRLIPSGEINYSVKRLSDLIALYDFEESNFCASGLVSMSDRFDDIRRNAYRTHNLPVPSGFVFLSPGRNRNEARDRLIASIGAATIDESKSDIKLLGSQTLIFGDNYANGALSLLQRIKSSIGMTPERECELIYIGSRDVRLGRHSRVYLV